jgi:bifunctional non-homologous end joining protein LigD
MPRKVRTPPAKPTFIAPMQARLVQKLPDGIGWMYEAKFDGYRAIVIKDGDHVEIRSRNNKDLTAAYPTVCATVRRVKAKRAVLDGEIVAVDASGVPSFQALQHRSARTDHQIVYYVFDLLHYDGVDLLREALTKRRARLPPAVSDSGVLLSIELPGTASQVVEAVSALGLEGVVAKRRDSKYEPGDRSGAWVKLKLDKQQEFVVGGYRPDVRTVGALLVGYYDVQSLQFAGKVRAGMTPRIRAQLFDVLKPLRIERCPFDNLPNSKSSHWGTGVTAEEMNEMVWVQPNIVVQIRFVEWTAEANLRHAAFVGLRTDKKARQVRRET